jgi:hypothetical protein
MDKKLSNCYGTWRYVTVLTRINHWILSWASSVHSTPSHPNRLRYILIFWNLCIDLPNVRFTSGSVTTVSTYFLDLVYKIVAPPWRRSLHHHSIIWKQIVTFSSFLGPEMYSDRS